MTVECPYCEKPLSDEQSACCGEVGHGVVRDASPSTEGERLKDCPFCGNAPTLNYDSDSDTEQVQCYWCSASGPEQKSGRLPTATQAWNRRSPGGASECPDCGSDRAKCKASPRPCCPDCKCAWSAPEPSGKAERMHLTSLRDRMVKAVEPWLGVRADIIPPSVQSIAAWINEVNSMLESPPEPRDEPLPPCSTCGGETVPFCTSCGYTTTKVEKP